MSDIRSKTGYVGTLPDSVPWLSEVATVKDLLRRPGVCLDFSFFKDGQLAKELQVEVSCQDLAFLSQGPAIPLRLGDEVKLYSTAR